MAARLNDGKVGPKSDTKLQDSLDELARLADSLVDGLSETEPSAEEANPGEAAARHTAAVQASEATRRSTPPEIPADAAAAPDGSTSPAGSPRNRDSMKETLDALSALVDDPSPPPRSAEIVVEGDRGEDIEARLESMLDPSISPETDAADDSGPTDPEPAVVEPAEVAVPVAATSSVATEKLFEAKVDPIDLQGSVAGSPDPLAVGDDADVEPEIDAYVAIPERESKLGLWLTIGAIVVAVAAAAAYAWWSSNAKASTEDAAGVRSLDDVALPDPPVTFKKPIAAPAEPEPAAPRGSRFAPAAAPGSEPASGTFAAGPALAAGRAEPAAVAPAAALERPEEVFAGAATAPEITETASASLGLAPPSSKARVASLRPALVTGAVFEATEAADTAAGVLSKRWQPIASSVEPMLPDAVAAPAPRNPKPDPAPLAEVARAASVGTTVTPAATRVPSAPPVNRPPAVRQRTEPTFKQRSLRPGQSETVVLRVLVNETGRVVRVVVNQGTSIAELESAAINAVLRWSYEPAIENDRPVRSWTTETFVFERPLD